MSAQASARKFVHLFPVAVDFERDSPFGKRIRTPAPPFFTALSADPSEISISQCSNPLAIFYPKNLTWKLVIKTASYFFGRP